MEAARGIDDVGRFLKEDLSKKVMGKLACFFF